MIGDQAVAILNGRMSRIAHHAAIHSVLLRGKSSAIAASHIVGCIAPLGR